MKIIKGCLVQKGRFFLVFCSFLPHSWEIQHSFFLNVVTWTSHKANNSIEIGLASVTSAREWKIKSKQTLSWVTGYLRVSVQREVSYYLTLPERAIGKWMLEIIPLRARSSFKTLTKFTIYPMMNAFEKGQENNDSFIVLSYFFLFHLPFYLHMATFHRNLRHIKKKKKQKTCSEFKPKIYMRL